MHLYLKSNILYSEELNGPYKYIIENILKILILFLRF